MCLLVSLNCVMDFRRVVQQATEITTIGQCRMWMQGAYNCCLDVWTKHNPSFEIKSQPRIHNCFGVGISNQIFKQMYRKIATITSFFRDSTSWPERPHGTFGSLHIRRQARRLHRVSLGLCIGRLLALLPLFLPIPLR